MARAKKEVVQEDNNNVVVAEHMDGTPHVTVHLDRDPNDPRKSPIVDGNEQAAVDINVPA